MSISLEKRTETALVSLQKMAEKAPTDLGDVCAQVTLEVDFSASMSNFYRRGLVQEIVERALALSMTGLDDDKIVPVTFFDSQVYEPIEVIEHDYHDVVQKFMAHHSMGGTNYAGPLEKALGGGKRKFLGRAKADDPSAPPFLHLFVTDGEPGDGHRAEKLLIEARTRPHFFQFIFVGDDPRGEAYLQHLNNGLSGPGVDNVGVTVYADPANVDDARFFDDIVSEFFPIWLPAARTAGFTNR